MYNQDRQKVKKTFGWFSSPTGKLAASISVHPYEPKASFELAVPGIVHVLTSVKLPKRLHSKLSPGPGCTARVWGTEWTQRVSRLKIGHCEDMEGTACGKSYESMHHDLTYQGSDIAHINIAEVPGVQTIPEIRKWLGRDDDLTLYVYTSSWRRKGLLGFLMPAIVDYKYSFIRRSRYSYPPAISVDSNAGYPGTIEPGTPLMDVLKIMAKWSSTVGRELRL